MRTTGGPQTSPRSGASTAPACHDQLVRQSKLVIAEYFIRAARIENRQDGNSRANCVGLFAINWIPRMTYLVFQCVSCRASAMNCPRYGWVALLRNPPHLIAQIFRTPVQPHLQYPMQQNTRRFMTRDKPIQVFGHSRNVSRDFRFFPVQNAQAYYL